MSFPFTKQPVPICYSIDELTHFLEQYKSYQFCLYLAYKDEEGWEKSTSRAYMNQVLPNFIYLPVNIAKDDFGSLRRVYEIAEENDQIIAINQTQPHKSNPVIIGWFKGLANIPTNIDALIKDGSGKLRPYDLNGPSFVGWFTDAVGSFNDKFVILVGAGGVGEPIARSVIKDQPAQLFLVDPVNKEELRRELSATGNVEYSFSLDSVRLNPDKEMIVINCAGKEGATDQSGIYGLLEQYQSKDYIFVDLRPYLEIDVVEKAKELGWRAYTGYGMNARNDYTLVLKIAELIEETPPSFDRFKGLVANAS